MFQHDVFKVRCFFIPSSLIRKHDIALLLDILHWQTLGSSFSKHLTQFVISVCKGDANHKIFSFEEFTIISLSFGGFHWFVVNFFAVLVFYMGGCQEQLTKSK